ncbi:hypothetical protein [Sphingobium sp. EM0848]|uniref:hypothetical protein n=1 Tax=Sphingobium sp. EM0848 TaxID=2743473 RepID=UPI00159CBF06|nr:hypothetical protein [Sphingobium sp. EM0848]
MNDLWSWFRDFAPVIVGVVLLLGLIFRYRRKNIAQQLTLENRKIDLQTDPMSSAEISPIDLDETHRNNFPKKDNIEHNDLMKRYEIKHVIVDQYEYGRFRYSNLDDAVAQARRDDKIS